METKTFEIRDKATFIPAVGILMESISPPDVYLLRRAGYGQETNRVLLMSLNGGGRAEYDPYAWRGRTWLIAHEYITNHWAELESGAVICVEYILGERATPKITERLET